MVGIEMLLYVKKVTQKVFGIKEGRSAITLHLRKVAFIFTPKNVALLFCNMCICISFYHTVAMHL
jgi:hypothetical protein